MVDQVENTNDNSGMNLAELSDEQLLGLDPSRFDGSMPEAESEGPDTDLDTSEEETGGAVSEELQETDDRSDSTLDEEDESEGSDESPEDTSPDPYSDDQSVQEEEEEPEDQDDSTDTPDYKSEYERALSPLRASGKTIQPKSMDELRRLAQMGYDYGRKVAALKPQQKILQTLERNELSLDDINYLVDLRKGNPEAIRKLLKDNSIDPMDLSDEEGGEYSPTDHSVSDQEVAVNEVIQEISSTSHYTTTVERVKGLDTVSKEQLRENPEALRTLNEHVGIGLYDEVMDEVNHRRAMGELTGLSDLVAYNQVGEAMAKAGAFDKYQSEQSSPPAKSRQSAQGSGSSSAKKAENLRNRKRAAAPTRGKASTGKEAIDFGKLSDEEMAKIDPTTL